MRNVAISMSRSAAAGYEHNGLLFLARNTSRCRSSGKKAYAAPDFASLWEGD